MGLCVDGRVLRGKNGNAGHAGHTFVERQQRRPVRLRHGGRCGGAGGGRRHPQALRRTGLAELGRPVYRSTFAAIPAALGVVDELCVVMRVAPCSTWRPRWTCSALAIGGSVFWHNQAELLPRLRAFVAGKLPALTDGLEIVPAGLGERVGDFAALALVTE